MATQTLKYLFKAEFEDSTTIEQTPEDVSNLDPKRSQFYDVLQYKSKLVRFSLKEMVYFIGGKGVSPALDGHTVAVDLRTGVFEFDGKEFVVGDEIDTDEEFQLIYYRRNRIHFNTRYEEQGRETAYFIGFQTNDKNGKNIERKIGIE